MTVDLDELEQRLEDRWYTIWARAKIRRLIAELRQHRDTIKAQREAISVARADWRDRPLLERKAVFVYEGARLQAVAVDAPIIPESWDQRDEAFRKQFLDIIERYCAAPMLPTPEEAHDSWWQSYEAMGWTYGELRDPAAKTHPDMVPFSDLEQREQDKDAVFLALVEMARDWVRAALGGGDG